jgi:hypothetical protein
MPHTFYDFFPMKDRPDEGVTGAYTWLTKKQYLAVSRAIENSGRTHGFDPSDKRCLLTGLIYDQSLISDFLETCWTRRNRDRSVIGQFRSGIGRLEKMDEFHRQFKRRPALVGWLAGQLSTTTLNKRSLACAQAQPQTKESLSGCQESQP